MIASADTALARLYALRARADAAADAPLSARLAARISDLSTSVMRLRIERAGIVETELQRLTKSLHDVAQAADESLQDIKTVEATLARIAAFLALADKVIARVTSF